MYLDSHPIHRDSDIANHKNEINCSDYRFVYMGEKGMFYFTCLASIVKFCGSTRKLPCIILWLSPIIIMLEFRSVGTWTPLHADVFRSYSWSANVCGRKQWLFLPPSQSHRVFDRYKIVSFGISYNFGISYHCLLLLAKTLVTMLNGRMKAYQVSLLD